MVKDGKYITNLYTGISRGGNYSNIKEVAAVGFFDFNADGMKDIVIIGESELGNTILLEESIDSKLYL